MKNSHDLFKQVASDFLKLRDESVEPDEADDAERKASAEYLLELIREKHLDIIDDDGNPKFEEIGEAVDSGDFVDVIYNEDARWFPGEKVYRKAD